MKENHSKGFNFTIAEIHNIERFFNFFDTKRIGAVDIESFNMLNGSVRRDLETFFQNANVLTLDDIKTWLNYMKNESGMPLEAFTLELGDMLASLGIEIEEDRRASVLLFGNNFRYGDFSGLEHTWIAQFFLSFDLNEDGKIDTNDMKALAKNYKVGETIYVEDEEDAKELLDELCLKFDLNQDGVISVDEMHRSFATMKQINGQEGLRERIFYFLGLAQIEPSKSDRPNLYKNLRYEVSPSNFVDDHLFTANEHDQMNAYFNCFKSNNQLQKQ